MIVARGTPILYRNQVYFARSPEGRRKQHMDRLEMGTLHLYGSFSIATPAGMRNVEELGRGDLVSFFPYLHPEEGEGLLTQSGQQMRIVASHELWSLGAEFFAPPHTPLARLEESAGRPVEHAYLLSSEGSFLHGGHRQFFTAIRSMSRVQLLSLLRGIFFAVASWERLWPGLSKPTRQHLYGRLTTTSVGRLAGHAGIVAYRADGDRMVIPDSLYAWNVQNFGEKSRKEKPKGMTLSVAQHFSGRATAVSIVQNTVIGFKLEEIL